MFGNNTDELVATIIRLKVLASIDLADCIIEWE